MGQPIMIVFAGPNGSGKSSLTSQIQRICSFPRLYINADNLKSERNMNEKQAADTADRLRQQAVISRHSFVTETLLSTTKNINLMRVAQETGFFVYLVYVLTMDPLINVNRVKYRADRGGHFIPPEKVITRYHRAIDLIPEAIQAANHVEIYDNSYTAPVLIFGKKPIEHLGRSGNRIKTNTYEDFSYPQPFPSKWNLTNIKRLVYPKNTKSIKGLLPPEVYYENKIAEVIDNDVWHGKSDDINIVMEMINKGYSKTDIHVAIILKSPGLIGNLVDANRYAEDILKYVLNVKLQAARDGSV
ncbi:zeta toxin family protein [Sporomusa sphaeroides]|uniref:zeta toxin family protein n=1 Tax=Sporomusa sphaeroides TaxID=47679 RepID=UPI002C4DAC21|nr:zeta toxin family protein [Sporomusa sphaeroides]HML34187.1 zeta toxin family protein [Sporomusa sphaeroides]